MRRWLRSVDPYHVIMLAAFAVIAVAALLG